jgi:LPXTG-site transpeptidase (sortase) family protein
VSKAKWISLGVLIIGIVALIQINLPLISYKIWEFQYAQDKTILISPQGDNQVMGVSIQNTEGNFPAFISSTERAVKPMAPTFTVSIPKLKIDKALVTVDSNDMSNSLAHLPGTALPGERGNVFISGHSSIPLLFKGNKDYGTIFANLSQVKKGDIVTLNFGGGNISYKIFDIKIVDPKDTSVINPPASQGRFVSLMTCVPPGFNTKRLVVIGQSI